MCSLNKYVLNVCKTSFYWEEKVNKIGMQRCMGSFRFQILFSVLTHSLFSCFSFTLCYLYIPLIFLRLDQWGFFTPLLFLYVVNFLSSLLSKGKDQGKTLPMVHFALYISLRAFYMFFSCIFVDYFLFLTVFSLCSSWHSPYPVKQSLLCQRCSNNMFSEKEGHRQSKYSGVVWCMLLL